VAIATKIFWAVRLQPGRIVSDHARSEAHEFDPKATLRRPSGERPRSRRDDYQPDPRKGRAQEGRNLRVVAGRLVPGKIWAISCIPALVPTIPTTSSRTSTGASCARCASSARGRTSRIGRRRTQLDALATSNGRTVVKHYLQDVGSTFGLNNDLHEWDLSYEHFYQGDTLRKRFFSFGFRAEPVADDRLRRVSIDRQVRGRSIRSQEVAAPDPDAGLLGVAG
jgi:hypothetical protein